MAWEFNSREPVFVQIANKLRADIVSGRYSSSEQFPSVRQIACDAAVNPNTVQRALTMLEEERILYNRGTVGRFITTDTSVISDARDGMRRRAVRSIIIEAEALGMGIDELIDYIKEEKGE